MSMKNSNDNIWIFFCTVFLYWSRYRLYICQSVLSRQTFASFVSRYLAAEAVASHAPCLPIGSSSLCMYFFPFFLGTVPFAVALLCRCRSPSCPGCIHLVVATFGSFFCSSAGFQPWSISRILR